jgi:hypothetical protein
LVLDYLFPIGVTQVLPAWVIIQAGHFLDDLNNIIARFKKDPDPLANLESLHISQVNETAQLLLVLIKDLESIPADVLDRADRRVVWHVNTVKIRPKSGQRRLAEDNNERER